jgi:hypothetical protein
VKGKRIDAWFSGKAHEFARNVQGIMPPSGIPLWTSEVHPGSAISQYIWTKGASFVVGVIAAGSPAISRQ